MSAARDWAAVAVEAWPGPTEYLAMGVNLGTVLGDINRHLRAHHEGDALDADVGRELMNLSLMAARYTEELGLDLDACTASAVASQRAYRTERGWS